MATENKGVRKLGDRSPLVMAASVRNFQQGRLKSAINSLLAIVGELNYSASQKDMITHTIGTQAKCLKAKIDEDWEKKKAAINGNHQHHHKFADTINVNMTRQPVIGEIIEVMCYDMRANYEIVSLGEGFKGIGKLLKA